MGTKGVIPLVPFLVLLVIALVVWGLVETAPSSAPPDELEVWVELQNGTDQVEWYLRTLARARFRRVVIVDHVGGREIERIVRLWRRTHPEVLYVGPDAAEPPKGPVRIVLDATQREGQDATGRVLEWLGGWRLARQPSDRVHPG